MTEDVFSMAATSLLALKLTAAAKAVHDGELPPENLGAARTAIESLMEAMNACLKAEMELARAFMVVAA